MVLLIVNMDRDPSNVDQSKQLQEMYEKYKEHDFYVLGFACSNKDNKNQEPMDNYETLQWYKNTYNITFPMFANVIVKGLGANPLWKFMQQ